MKDRGQLKQETWLPLHGQMQAALATIMTDDAIQWN